VSIDNFYYEKKYNTYYYEYSYFPSSDGFCYESSLRKLTKSEKIIVKLLFLAFLWICVHGIIKNKKKYLYLNYIYLYFFFLTNGNSLSIEVVQYNGLPY